MALHRVIGNCLNRIIASQFTFASTTIGRFESGCGEGCVKSTDSSKSRQNTNSFSTQSVLENSNHQSITVIKSSVRIGVIGCGRIGHLHSKTIKESNGLGKLIWISDSDPQNGLKLALERNTPFLHNSKLEDAFRSPKDDPRYVDAVIVCSPNSTHPYYVSLSLDHQKHVMCEKPMVSDPTQMLAIFKSAEDRNRKLLIGFQRVFDLDIARLIEQVKDTTKRSKEGPISISMRCYDSPLAPSNYLRTCGSIFADAMCHDIHVASSLLEPQIELHSAIAKEAPFRDTTLGARSASIVFTTQDGTLITIEFHRVSQIGYDNTIDVNLGNKMFRLQSRPRFAVTEASGDGFLTSADYDDSFITKYFGAYRQEVHHFLKSVQEDGAFDQEHMRECVRAMWMVKLAEDASKSGQEVLFKNY